MNKINRLTKSSILIGITLVILYTSKLFPIADLTLLTLSSGIICLSIIKFGIKNSILILISSFIICLILGLIKYSLSYLVFFGSYPFIKLNIEKLNHIFFEILIKILYSFILFFIYSYIYFSIFTKVNFNLLYLFLISIAGVFVFFIYDFCLNTIIRFINNNKLLSNL